jgi:hypothetical protein
MADAKEKEVRQAFPSQVESLGACRGAGNCDCISSSKALSVQTPYPRLYVVCRFHKDLRKSRSCLEIVKHVAYTRECAPHNLIKTC